MIPSKLPLNLIPSTSWWKNVRSKIPKAQWDLIRKKVYKKATILVKFAKLKILA